MKPPHQPAPNDGDDTTLDPNTTLDIIVGPDDSMTELSDTVDAMDGAAVEVIDIVNQTDGTAIEVTVIEEPTDSPGIDQVDRFVRIEGIGPHIAGLLYRAGIRRFSQLAQTPAGRILEILSAGGTHYRIHDATRWREQAKRLAD